MAALSEVMYPVGSAPPHFSYTLKQLPSNLEGVEVKIGSEKLAGRRRAENFRLDGRA